MQSKTQTYVRSTGALKVPHGDGGGQAQGASGQETIDFQGERHEVWLGGGVFPFQAKGEIGSNTVLQCWGGVCRRYYVREDPPGGGVGGPGGSRDVCNPGVLFLQGPVQSPATVAQSGNATHATHRLPRVSGG